MRTVLRVGAVLGALVIGLVGREALAADDLTGLQQEMQEAKLASRRLRAEEEALVERERQAEASLRKHVRALYRMSRAGMLPLAGGIGALMDHAARVSRLRRVVARDGRLLDSLRTRRRLLRAERARQAQRLAELTERLSTLEAQRRQAHRDALAEAMRSSRFAPAFAGGTSSGSGFVAQRGQLASPLSGTFRVAAPQEDHPAIQLLGSPSAAVRAAADGRVAFADGLDGEGLVVVLDHGGGWFTVYAGLGQVAVQLDDYVGRGAVLGHLGGSGSLRFEVRRGQQAVDPSPWLGF